MRCRAVKYALNVRKRNLQKNLGCVEAIGIFIYVPIAASVRRRATKNGVSATKPSVLNTCVSIGKGENNIIAS